MPSHGARAQVSAAIASEPIVADASPRDYDVARPADLGISPAALARLSGALRREIDRKTIPGAVTMIGRRGGIALAEALGVQNPATGAPMRLDSVFRIFSMAKPVTSVGLMMLVEEGRLRIEEPVSAYIPEFARLKVARRVNGRIELEEPKRAATIQDLLRHTAGLSHEIVPTRLQDVYAAAKLARRDQTNEEHARRIAELPLLCHPGEAWNYSRGVEVLGRVIEVISGETLGDYLERRIFTPLGMPDTAFHVASETAAMRIAEPFPVDPWTNKPVALFNPREEPRFEAGGGGLMSTAPDYARFARMLARGGTLDGERILGSRTIAFMTANHLDPSITHAPDPLPPGYGFGLGFAVRTSAGRAPFPGAIGQYFWNGAAGTQFWVDPAEDLWVVMMAQAPGQKEHLRVLIRNLVYAALDD